MVHRRGHGEHFNRSADCFHYHGSSPWARGTQFKNRHTPRIQRFIPVGTGNTYSRHAKKWQDTVHPRGHGEHSNSPLPILPAFGSSPWARGTLHAQYETYLPFRFIPVGTGNTSSLTMKLIMSAVHPRGHGEHPFGQLAMYCLNGSSPWARGTQFTQVRGSSVSRFIPVGTGNTWVIKYAVHGIPVHPRGHGEHFMGLGSVGLVCGSSPWARGTLRRGFTNGINTRFIPVGTGNTKPHPVRSPIKTVHPRGHGEHIMTVSRILIFHGSSPWARGTHQQGSTDQRCYRFIPVGTGNTWWYRGTDIFDAVHPRGHGEHNNIPYRLPVCIGSSPWARGTLQ